MAGVPRFARLRLRFLAAALAAVALVTGTELALRDALGVESVHPALAAAVGEQRMLAERVAQTALRLADAPREERAPLLAQLQETLQRSGEIQDAFRSVDAPVGRRRVFAAQTVPEWRELDAEHARLRSEADAFAA